jgi:hypothetical protein
MLKAMFAIFAGALFTASAYAENAPSQPTDAQQQHFADSIVPVARAAYFAKDAVYPITIKQADGTDVAVQVGAKDIFAFISEFDLAYDTRPDHQPAPRPDLNGTLAPVLLLGTRTTPGVHGILVAYPGFFDLPTASLQRTFLHEVITLTTPMAPYYAGYLDHPWPHDVEVQIDAAITKLLTSRTASLESAKTSAFADAKAPTLGLCSASGATLRFCLKP